MCLWLQIWVDYYYNDESCDGNLESDGMYVVDYRCCDAGDDKDSASTSWKLSFGHPILAQEVSSVNSSSEGGDTDVHPTLIPILLFQQM